MAGVGGRPVSSSQSQLVVVHCLKAFVKLHNEGGCMSWTGNCYGNGRGHGNGVDTVLQWMLTDIDDRQLQQVRISLTFTALFRGVTSV